MKVLVAGPYVGELGWELFSWQPMVRRVWLDNKPDKTIVYTRPGRRLFYRFADEVRDQKLPDHEAECLAWHDLDKYMDEFTGAIRAVQEQAKQEFKGHNIVFFGYPALKQLNRPYYAQGAPDLLYGEQKRAEELLAEHNNVVVLCVRDRAMSDYRNWPYEEWAALGRYLAAGGWSVVYLGRIRDMVRWNVLMSGVLTSPQREGVVIDLTNRTSLDDCLSVMSRARLAVGGSSGLLHLASRCGLDHLVWGAPSARSRYAETNWFGAHFKFLSVGWQPKWEDIASEAEHYLEKGAFRP